MLALVNEKKLARLVSRSTDSTTEIPQLGLLLDLDLDFAVVFTELLMPSFWSREKEKDDRNVKTFISYTFIIPRI